MSSKSQDKFTFDEAKKVVNADIHLLVKFAEELDDWFPNAGFLIHATNLGTLEQIVQNANSRCLTQDQIEQIDIFRLNLVKGLPRLTPKLQAFWNLYQDILQRLKGVSPVPAYAPSKVIERLMPRIEEADNLAYDTVDSARKNLTNILSATSLLSVHVKRTESIEYAISEQLEDATKTFSLGSYDINDMCSVDSKIQKGSVWRSDVRAIRDAIAHDHFTIRQTDNDWEIEFHNTEKGYDFNKTFTRKEFTSFFDHHTFLYKIQIHLLIIIQVISILVTHFMKKQ